MALAAALVQVRSSVSPDDYLTALKTMHTFAKNVEAKPTEEKYRRVRLSNEIFQKRVGKIPGGLEAMRAIGFKEVPEDSDEAFKAANEGHLALVPTEQAWIVLLEAKQSLETHIQQAQAAAGGVAGAGFAGAPVGGAPVGVGANPMLSQAQQMMGNPALSGALNNPDMMNQMATMMPMLMQNPQLIHEALQNPQLQAMMGSNPMLAQIMQNPEAIQQALSDPMAQELLSNPAAMQQAAQAIQGGGRGVPGMPGVLGSDSGVDGMGGPAIGASVPGVPAAPPANRAASMGAGEPVGGALSAADEEEMLRLAIEESLKTSDVGDSETAPPR